MERDKTHRIDEPSRSQLYLLATAGIGMLAGLLVITGIALLATGTASGGFSLAAGAAAGALAALALFGRQGEGFLGVAAIALGGFSAASMLFLDYTWAGFFITLVSGIIMVFVGAFLIGEAADLHIGMDATE